MLGMGEILFLAAGAGILLIIVGVISQMSRAQRTGPMSSNFVGNRGYYPNSDPNFYNTPDSSGGVIGDTVGAEVGASADQGGSSVGESVGSDIGSSMDFGGGDFGGGDSGGGDSGGGDSGGGD